MIISLSELINQNAQERLFTSDIEMDSFEYLGHTYTFVNKEEVNLNLVFITPRKLSLKVVIRCSLSGQCDRCLEPVEIPFDISTEHTLLIDEEGFAAESEDDNVSYINGYDLDVEALISEEIMIGFPMKVLCNDDCKGICKVCGANLNKGECGCDRTELDPRMSVIRDLFKDFDFSSESE